MSTTTRSCPRCRTVFTGPHYWRVCKSCYFAQLDEERTRETYTKGYRAGIAASTPLDDETLMAIVRLTHPDRHPPERNAEATRITALLLSMREPR